MNRGWQCPSCGGCYAPWKAKCSECPPVKSVGSSDTNELPDGFGSSSGPSDSVKEKMQQARLGGTTGPYDAGKDRGGRR